MRRNVHLRLFASFSTRLFFLVICGILVSCSSPALTRGDDETPRRGITQWSISESPAEKSTETLPQSPTSTETLLRNFVQKTIDALSAPVPPKPPESILSYFLKKVVDLITTPAIWIGIGASFLALAFWWCYRAEITAFVQDLSKVKFGELELARERLEEIKSDFANETFDFDFLEAELAEVDERNVPRDFFSLRHYPLDKIGRDLSEPYFSVRNWQSLRPALEELAVRLINEETRLRASRYFGEPNPPSGFISLKRQVSLFLLHLGIFYGFAKSFDPQPRRLVDLERALSYLQKAIDLMPEEKPERGIGYARFCLGAVKGFLGIKLFDEPANDPLLRGEGRALMRAAIKELKKAEENGYESAEQYHLQAYMFFSLGEITEAAEAWRKAVEMKGTAKMCFNYACALSQLGHYRKALTALEEAVDLDDQFPQQQRFDVRAKAYTLEEGAEFQPFWAVSGSRRARRATSTNGKSFDEITRYPRPYLAF